VGDEVGNDPAASSAAQPERDGGRKDGSAGVRNDGSAVVQGSPLREMGGGGGGLPNSSHAAAATLRRILETEVTLFLSHDSAAFKRAGNMSNPLGVDLYRLSRFLFMNSQMSSGIQLCVRGCVGVWVCGVACERKSGRVSMSAVCVCGFVCVCAQDGGYHGGFDGHAGEQEGECESLNVQQC
jgi:hypothetical protein